MKVHERLGYDFLACAMYRIILKWFLFKQVPIDKCVFKG